MDLKKIRFGAHIFIWIEKWSSAEIQLMERAKDLGLHGLDISIGDDVEFDEKLIRKESESLDLEIFISPGNLWPMEADISLPGKEAGETALAWHNRWISRAANAGVKAYSGALYGHPGCINRVAPDPEEHKRICERLHAMAEHAQREGIKILLEPMSHFRTHVANTAWQLLGLLEGASHENLYVLVDTYHMMTETRHFGNDIRLLGDKLFCIHACENDRGCPGDGLVPWDEIASALNDIHFSRYIFFESYNSTIRNGDFAYSRGMFHNVCPDGDAFVREGMGFLKQKLKQA
jgi:D-psicose/D-tagatose/L-ribulose 3-epimerase